MLDFLIHFRRNFLFPAKFETIMHFVNTNRKNPKSRFKEVKKTILKKFKR